jgi:pimeloyl-ACP methyl ester carboxylesterase
LIGCGSSGRAGTWQRCTIDEYRADLIVLCGVLEIDQPVVIGHSLGAATVLRATTVSCSRRVLQRRQAW